MIADPQATVALLDSLGFSAEVSDGSVVACWDFDCADGQEQEDAADDALFHSSELLRDNGLRWKHSETDNDSVCGVVDVAEEEQP